MSFLLPALAAVLNFQLEDFLLTQTSDCLSERASVWTSPLEDKPASFSFQPEKTQEKQDKCELIWVQVPYLYHLPQPTIMCT